MRGWTDILRDWPDDVTESYNVAPTSNIAAFRSAHGVKMRWGLVPSWSDEFDSKYATFNARVETVHEKPTFRSAWKNQQRCLIPMAGYYEWRGPKGSKQPYYISNPDTALVMAGLYEVWGDAGQLSCTIITRPADSDLSHIHSRMPVMLTPDAAVSWLNKEHGDPQLFLTDTPKPEVRNYPVSGAVGNVRNDDPDLIKPTTELL